MPSTIPAEPFLRDVASVAEALFASRGPEGHAEAAPAARVAWLVDDLQHFLGTTSARTRAMFHAALRAVTTLGPAASLRLGAFHRMPLGDRIRALERLEHNAVTGMAVFAVKTMLCLIWYEHPDSAIEVGLVANVTALARRPRGRA